MRSSGAIARIPIIVRSIPIGEYRVNGECAGIEITPGIDMLPCSARAAADPY